MRAHRVLLLVALLVAGLISLGSNDAHKQGLSSVVPGLSGVVGDDSTLSYLQNLEEFEGLDTTFIRHQFWFDPYEGNDSNACTYELPCRSVHEMKERCTSYSRCTVKNRGKTPPLAFGMLTLGFGGANPIGVGEEFAVGESVTGTWGAGAGGASTGTVVAWDPETELLVITRLTGNDPVAEATDIVTGALSGAVGEVISVTNTLNLGGGTTIDEAIIADCDKDKDALCVVFDVEDPGVPVVIDGNRFGLQGNAVADTCGLWCAGGTGTGGWVGVAGIQTQNLASDVHTTADGGSIGKLVAVRTAGVNIRNGTEVRGVAGAAFNPFTAHGAGGGIFIVNAGPSDSRVDDGGGGGSGSPIASSSDTFLFLVGRSRISATPVAANVSVVMNCSSQSCDEVVVGHELFQAGNLGVISFIPVGGGQLQLARALVNSSATTVTVNEVLVQSVTSGLTEARLYETTIRENPAGTGRALTTNCPAGTTLSLLARGLVIDPNVTFAGLFDDSGASDCYTRAQISLEGAFDDHAAAFNNGTTSFTAAGIQADQGGTWRIFASNSFDQALVQWGSDTDAFRCSSARECWEAFDPSYVVEFTTTSYGADILDSCLPRGVMAGASRLCYLRLTPTHIGAR